MLGRDGCRVIGLVLRGLCLSSREEDGHGALRWAGRPPEELHLRGNGPLGRTGSIRTRVYEAPLHLAALRHAVRGYGFAVRDVVRAMCRLRSVFQSRGVAVNDGNYSPKGRGKWLAELTSPHRRLAQWLGRQLDQLVPLREEAEEWLVEEAKTHPIIGKLATAPGMGPIRTAQVVAITANPHRFRTRRQYWSYCGFGIVTRSSSDWVQTKDGRWERAQVLQTRGLTRKRHPLLKWVFKGAATTVITPLPEHPLHKDYERMLAAGIKPKFGIDRVADLTPANPIARTGANASMVPGSRSPVARASVRAPGRGHLLTTHFSGADRECSTDRGSVGEVELVD
jgi:transposase